jgi:hypothetical protein
MEDLKVSNTKTMTEQLDVPLELNSGAKSGKEPGCQGTDLRSPD